MRTYKRLAISLFFVIFPMNLFAEEFEPFSRQLKEGDEIILKGHFSIWNGQPPNIRFITAENKVMGIGEEEDYPNETVERIIAAQMESNVLYETKVVLQYIGEISIPYYGKPLMCFDVRKIKILKQIPRLSHEPQGK